MIVKESTPKGPNVFGKLLARYRSTKKLALDDARAKLSDRNRLNKDYNARAMHRFEEAATVYRDGKEVIEIRLYKLIDAAVVTIDSDVSSSLEGGIGNLREFNRDGE